MLERQEAVEVVIGIAGPIRDYSCKLIAALGIAVATGKSQKKGDLDHYIDLVREPTPRRRVGPGI